MHIKTLGHVNGRTADGRVYAAGEGAETVIDDDDEGMVTLIRGFVDSGLVELLDDPEPPDLDELRVEAEAAGVKVDKRWGPERLAAEIATAESADKDDDE